MPRSFQLTDFLPSIAPNALCDDCIRDRVPIRARQELPRMISELAPPGFERSTGECSACTEVRDVTRYVGAERTTE